jgi:uncharacterized protein YbjT (DUF2867 family)
MVGRPIVARLAAEGHRVTALVRDVDAAGRVLPAGVTLARGDVRDPGTLRGPLAAADAAVVVLPLSAGDRGGFNAERDGTANLVAALPPGRPVDLVKVSEIGAGSDPGFFDLACKADAERAVATSGHPYVVFRPTWFMEAWHAQLRAGAGPRADLLVVGAAERRIHWVALADLARWVAAAVARFDAVRGATLTVQGPDALTFAEAAARLADAAGLGVVRLPADAVVGGLPPGAPPGLGPTLRELFGYYERAPEPFEAAALWARLGPPRVGFDAFAEAFADAVGRDAADKTAIRTGLREP